MTLNHFTVKNEKAGETNSVISFVCIASCVAFIKTSLRLSSQLGQKTDPRSITLIFSEVSFFIYVQQSASLHASSSHANQPDEIINRMH